MGVEDAWTQRYFSAEIDNIGNMPLFFHHQRVALSLVKREEGFYIVGLELL